MSKLSTVNVQIDDQIREQIEKFQAEFGDGMIPMRYMMPFLLLLGMYAYRRGFRLEPEIKLGDDYEAKG
jgi:hypothetical protein